MMILKFPRVDNIRRLEEAVELVEEARLSGVKQEHKKCILQPKQTLFLSLFSHLLPKISSFRLFARPLSGGGRTCIVC